MNILEKEIVEKFQQLDADAQERVLAQLIGEQHSDFDYGQWWSEVAYFQEGIRAKAGGKAEIGALSLLDELREEES